MLSNRSVSLGPAGYTGTLADTRLGGFRGGGRAGAVATMGIEVRNYAPEPKSKRC